MNFLHFLSSLFDNLKKRFWKRTHPNSWFWTSTLRSNSINIRRRNVLYVSRILPNWENIQGYSQKLRLFKLRLSYTKNISRFPCLVLCVQTCGIIQKLTIHMFSYERKVLFSYMVVNILHLVLKSITIKYLFIFLYVQSFKTLSPICLKF